MANTYTLISSVTVGAGGASSIDFTSIPAAYTDLVIKLSTRTTTGGIQALVFSMNGNTGSNYNWIYLQGSGSGTNTEKQVSQTTNNQFGVTDGSTSTTNTFSNNEIYFYNYTSSNNKSWSADGVEEENATAAYMRITAGLISITSALTSISIKSYGADNFAQYSTAYLYGIKNS